MTRKECESALIALMDQAAEIFRAYCPEAGNLSMFRDENGHINVHGHRKGFEIDGADYLDVANTYAVYATRFPDGDVWHSERWDRAMKEEEGCA